MTAVERLEAIAQELVCRIRDDDPEANDRWLRSVTTEQERHALLYLLAAAVPDDRSWRSLTAWVNRKPAPEPKELSPCGTVAAMRRHEYHGEEPCEPCREAERARDRKRKRAAYVSRKGSAA